MKSYLNIENLSQIEKYIIASDLLDTTKSKSIVEQFLLPMYSSFYKINNEDIKNIQLDNIKIINKLISIKFLVPIVDINEKLGYNIMLIYDSNTTTNSYLYDTENKLETLTDHTSRYEFYKKNKIEYFSDKSVFIRGFLFLPQLIIDDYRLINQVYINQDKEIINSCYIGSGSTFRTDNKVGIGGFDLIKHGYFINNFNINDLLNNISINSLILLSSVPEIRKILKKNGIVFNSIIDDFFYYFPHLTYFKIDKSITEFLSYIKILFIFIWKLYYKSISYVSNSMNVLDIRFLNKPIKYESKNFYTINELNGIGNDINYYFKTNYGVGSFNKYFIQLRFNELMKSNDMPNPIKIYNDLLKWYSSEPEYDCEHYKYIDKLYYSNDYKIIKYSIKKLKEFYGKNKDHIIYCNTCNNMLMCEHELELYNKVLSNGLYVLENKVKHLSKFVIKDNTFIGEQQYNCKYCGASLGSFKEDLTYTLTKELIDYNLNSSLNFYINHLIKIGLIINNKHVVIPECIRLITPICKILISNIKNNINISVSQKKKIIQFYCIFNFASLLIDMSKKIPEIIKQPEEDLIIKDVLQNFNETISSSNERVTIGLLLERSTLEFSNILKIIGFSNYENTLKIIKSKKLSPITDDILSLSLVTAKNNWSNQILTSLTGNFLKTITYYKEKQMDKKKLMFLTQFPLYYYDDIKIDNLTLKNNEVKYKLMLNNFISFISNISNITKIKLNKFYLINKKYDTTIFIKKIDNIKYKIKEVKSFIKEENIKKTFKLSYDEVNIEEKQVDLNVGINKENLISLCDYYNMDFIYLKELKNRASISEIYYGIQTIIEILSTDKKYTELLEIIGTNIGYAKNVFDNFMIFIYILNELKNYELSKEDIKKIKNIVLEMHKKYVINNSDLKTIQVTNVKYIQRKIVDYTKFSYNENIDIENEFDIDIEEDDIGYIKDDKDISADEIIDRIDDNDNDNNQLEFIDSFNEIENEEDLMQKFD